MGQRILLIDDLRENLDLMRILLSRKFPEVQIRVAQGGVAGWQAACEFLPDLVVLDAKMPDLDGFEVCRRIKSHRKTSGALVLMVSGEYVQPPDRISGWESGADGYLCKPYEVSDLQGQVTALLRLSADRRRLQQEALEPSEKERVASRLLRQNEAKFRTLFERSPEATLVHDRAGVVLDGNPAAAQLFGVSREGLLHRRLAALMGLEEDDSSVRAFLERLAADNSSGRQTAEWTVPLAGRHRVLDALARRIDFGGREAFLLLVRDASGRRKTEEALRHVAQGISAATGFRFFYALVERLADVLQADYLLIGEVNPHVEGELVTLAVAANGQPADNFTFRMHDTPFEDIARSRNVTRFDAVGKHLASHPAFAGWGATHLIGVPLLDSDGSLIGCLAALHHKALPDAEQASALLQLFAARAAAEMDRQRAVQDLWESEQKYRSLTDDVLDSFPLGTLILDAQRRLIWLNSSFESFFRLSRADLAGRDKSDIVALLRPMVKPAGVLEEAARDIRGRDGVTRKAVFRVVEGEKRRERWIEHWSEPIRSGLYIGGRIEYYSDITARRQAEEQRNRLALAVEHAGEAVVIVEPDRTIGYANPAFASLTGYSGGEVAGGSLDRILRHERNAKEIVRMWADAEQGQLWSGRLLVQKKDGGVFEAETTLSPMRDDGGRVVSFVFVAHDITSEREWEAKLRQAQKMESIGLLAGGIAHDFNNLLTSILGFSRLIRDGVDEGSEIREDIEEIIHSGERAAALTRQLLTLGRKQMVQMHPLDINAVVVNADQLLRRTLGEHIELVTILGERLGIVDADEGLIEQVVMNLAINARDAMPEGGRLYVETSTERLDEAYCSARVNLEPGEYVRLRIADTGMGMPPEVLEHAYEPFFTTKDKHKGSGLGLSTVYGIVQQCNGHMELLSGMGEGTEAIMHFPVLSRPVEEAVAEQPVKIAGGHETIMVVEDEDTVRNLTVRLLRSLGYHVVEARHGGEALALFESGTQDVDLLLSDVVMPHMGGYELTRRLQERGCKVKILYTSGFTGENWGQKNSAGQRHPLLQKPYTRDDLALMVRRVLDEDQAVDASVPGRDGDHT